MKNEKLNNPQKPPLQQTAVSTRFFRGAKMILDDDILVKVIYKAGDYVHIDKGNDEWTFVHYSRLS